MKRTKTLVSGILAAVSLLLTAGCDAGVSGGSDGGETVSGGGDPIVYSIGDTGPSGVGKVFYITDGGLHGMEAAPVDQSASVWIEGGLTQSTENGNTSGEIGTGEANSTAIMTQDGHTGSAAQVCQDYHGGDLTDWFLPSEEELNQLYLQRDSVGGFADGNYWSSTEISSSFALYQSFNNGNQGNFDKDYIVSVRAVRAF